MANLIESASRDFTHTVNGKPHTFPLLSYRDKAKILAAAAQAEREAVARDAKAAGVTGADLFALLRKVEVRYGADEAFIDFVNGKLGTPRDDARGAVLERVLRKRFPDAGEDDLADAVEALGDAGLDVLFKSAGLVFRGEGEADEIPLTSGPALAATGRPHETGDVSVPG